MAKPRGFTGSTKRAFGSAILGAAFWQPGVEISGAYLTSFPTAVGDCLRFRCLSPSKLTVHVDENNHIISHDAPGKDIEIDQFAIGALAGIQMAIDDLKANGFTGFKLHDRVWFKCVEIQEAQPGQNPMPFFEITVEP